MLQARNQRAVAVRRSYKTAVFKIHNPSRHKRALLDDALRRNHLAYTKTLQILSENIEAYAALEKRQRDTMMHRAAAKVVRRLPLSGAAKDGVINDVMGQINSYIELRSKQETVSPPTAQRLSSARPEYVRALEDFARTSTLHEENVARARLLAEGDGSLRPLLFLSNRQKNGYLFLYHPERGKYAIYLNLHSKKSRFASEVTIDGWVDVRTGEVMTFSSVTGCAFPVEFGENFQLERFLRKGIPQSAKLVKSQNAYEIHVTFLLETPKIETGTMMGVRRGVYNLASVCVMDGQGRVLHREKIEGRALWERQIEEEHKQREAQRKGRRYRSKIRRALGDEAAHRTANKIIEIAVKHKSQVVLANFRSLTTQRHMRAPVKVKHVLRRSQAIKLERILEYKLPVAGLPKPGGVAGDGMSRTCSECGEWNSGNIPQRPDKGDLDACRFVCLNCGYEDDADMNEARIIGQKKMWRDILPAMWRTKPTKEIPEELSFKRFLTDCAERRGSGPDTFGGRDLDESRTTPLE